MMDRLEFAKKKYAGIKSVICRIFKIVGYCEGWDDAQVVLNEKACQWLGKNVNNFIPDNRDYIDDENMGRMLKQFKDAMSESETKTLE